LSEDSSDTSPRDTSLSDSWVVQSAIQNCETPVEQFARFSEEGVLRGLTDVIPSTEREEGGKPIGRGGSVVASDLDADGDVDLLFHPFLSDPLVYINDGTGHFSSSNAIFVNDSGLYMGGVNAAAATDLNGDFVPEILVASAGYAGIYWSDGNAWLPMETLHRDDRPTGILPTEFASYLSLSLGDIDGDNDLDLVLPGTGSLGDNVDSNQSGGPDRLLENKEEGFELMIDLINDGEGSRTMVALFTDQNVDGNMDLFVPADGGYPSALWVNQGKNEDGVLTWKNTADALHADLEMAAMGIDSADLNEDGRLDYCISDRARPRCLLSAPDGTFYEAGQSMGVTPEEPANDRFTTTGWSIDFADLDNDGFLDLFQSSGPEGEALELGLKNYPDLVWRGLGGTQFQDVTLESGIGSTDDHYGHAIADFDGNGWLDVVVAGPMLQPRLFMAACGSANWLSLDLVGPANNTEAIGARVVARLSQRSDMREISSLRAQGQNPSLLHYGLGSSDTLEKLTVHWPDGNVETLQDLSANHHYTLLHPKALTPPWLEEQ
jgi:hypothetical protein